MPKSLGNIGNIAIRVEVVGRTMAISFINGSKYDKPIPDRNISIRMTTKKCYIQRDYLPVRTRPLFLPDRHHSDASGAWRLWRRSDVTKFSAWTKPQALVQTQKNESTCNRYQRTLAQTTHNVETVEPPIDYKVRPNILICTPTEGSPKLQTK